MNRPVRNRKIVPGPDLRTLAPAPDRYDSARAVAFLTRLHPNIPVQIVAMQPDGRPAARTFEPDQLDELRAHIEKKQGTQNIYFSVNQLRTSAAAKKAKKEDVVSSHCLHVDIDDVSALERILNARKPPTAVIYSGGGYQAFYRLAADEIDLARIERCNAGLAAELGGDNCWNVDRIMRVPWTVNVPNKKKREAGRTATVAYVVEEATDWTREYGIDAFEEAGAVDGPSAAAAPVPVPSEIPLVAIDALPAKVGDETRALIEQGDCPDHPMGSAEARYRSRSEVVFRVACDLARAGVDEVAIAGVLMNPALGISASVLASRSPSRYAVRQAHRAREVTGTEWPDVTKSGAPRPTLRNTQFAISRLGLYCEYDEFHRRKVIEGHTLQAFQGELSDDGCAVLRNEILQRFFFDPGKDHTREAANLRCLENTHHPVRDYLAGLTWDRQPRVERWLIDYLSADDTPLNQAFGRLVLTAAVRRARQPGYKFDTILVLEGPQGSGKSSAISILAGADNFSDQEILTLDAKAQMEAVEGVWLYELAELAGMKRTDTTRAKAFASRTVDRGRPAYGRFIEKRPRQFILIGTTNDDQYLLDPTGNRRFWPVKTRGIDLGALRRDRDQLWAEASCIEAGGVSLTLDESLWEAAREQQNARMEEDPWLEILRNLSTSRKDPKGIESGAHLTQFGDHYRISTRRILQKLDITMEQAMGWQLKRIATCMKNLGYEGPINFKVDGKVLKGYQIEVAKIARNFDPHPDY